MTHGHPPRADLPVHTSTLFLRPPEHIMRIVSLTVTIAHRGDTRRSPPSPTSPPTRSTAQPFEASSSPKPDRRPSTRRGRSPSATAFCDGPRRTRCREPPGRSCSSRSRGRRPVRGQLGVRPTADGGARVRFAARIDMSIPTRSPTSWSRSRLAHSSTTPWRSSRGCSVTQSNLWTSRTTPAVPEAVKAQSAPGEWEEELTG